VGLNGDERPTLAEWLRRPGANITVLEEKISTVLGRRPVRGALQTLEIELKYEGYIQQQERMVQRLKDSEGRQIPSGFAYEEVPGLRREIRDKVKRVGPATLGQAARIPGVTPAAIGILDIYINMKGATKDGLGAEAVEDPRLG